MTNKAKTAAAPKNTSAPAAAPGTDADVTAKGVEQSTSLASTEATGTQQLESTATPPEGEVPAPKPVAVTEVAMQAQAARPDDPNVTHLLVRSHVEGFRRAGRAWSKEQVQVAADDFTPEQIKALMDEPTLVVLPMAAGREEAGE